MTPEASILQGRNILIAEDGFALAAVLETVLSTFGCRIVGPVGCLADGLELVRERPLDGALLDVSLCDGDCFALADALLGRDIPVILVTGRKLDELPPRYQALPIVGKPFDMAQLVRLCGRTFGRPQAERRPAIKR